MLSLKNLTIKYGSKLVLNNITVNFRVGHISIIKGFSGSGKSSLLNVLGLLMKPNNECRYIYNETEINYNNQDKSSDFRLNNIGFIFQNNNLIQNLTVLQNVMLPMKIIEKDNEIVKQKAIELLQYVGIADLANSYPSEISGGEEQRVVIARALINDADIILADEPTASLDPENTNIIMELFKKLAYDLNKIVIIVSHDEKVCGYGDDIYNISDYSLICVKGNDIAEVKTDECSLDTVHKQEKKLSSFIKWYDKIINKTSLLTLLLMVVLSIVIAVSAIFVNFGNAYLEEQTSFVNSISDRSVLIINDSLGLNADEYYGDALAFTNEEIRDIKRIPNTSNIYPFYEFTSFGDCPDENYEQLGNTSIKVIENNDIINEVEYQSGMFGSDNDFSVSPLYPEENVEFLLEYRSDNYKEGAIITSDLANKLSNNPENLIGNEIQVECYVPIKLYSGLAKMDDGNELEFDSALSKRMIFNFKVTGILTESYKYNKSENNGDIILIDYEIIDNIVSDNKSNTFNVIDGELKEVELNPSMLVAFATDINNVETVKNKAEKISPIISTSSAGLDLKRMNDNFENTRMSMNLICISIIVIVSVLFGIIFFFRNLSRKREIGILKGLGLTSNEVRCLIIFDLIKISTKTFLLSLVTLLGFVLLSRITGLYIFVSINFYSILYMFILSFVIIIVAGLVAIWKTSKIDIIDAIKKNK